ncbi:hypothetical protein [Acaryochloris sp. IP29b_bin.148]|uniref:hypothetical protein n=1 Tax=Acaryochloris sp. IP29b_bin.148 TaxID=2969218 RepID=UPI0026145FA8|nr:hypothetical protein [Acaryochloris sp. IP29b_bin.148]
MISLKLMLPLVVGTLATLWGFPTWAGTIDQNSDIQRTPAQALGGEVTPSITLFPPVEQPAASQTPDLNLQVSGKSPLVTTANPDLWESELLDEQRRSDPGFFTITAD